jgi:hypothetical protein
MFGNRLARRTTVRLVCLLAGGAGGAAAACTKGVEPSGPPCTAAADTVTLAVDEYASIDPATDSGCRVFPATSGAAEYLIALQLTSGDTAIKAAFRVNGDTILPPPPPSPTPRFAELGSADRFHMFLRLGDERRFWGFAPELASTSGPLPRPSTTANPPSYNDLRTFQVCATLTCSRFDRVGARAKAINSKVAIFVDTLAPSGGLDSTALDSVARVFDQRLYAIDVAAFGSESDIDSNTVVIVLMTNTVNKLVSASDCQTSGFVAGFFFGVDIDPAFRNDSRSNKSEIFYSIVADPAGTLSCTHTAAEVQAFVPVTFIHEFQHMISFNQHVLIRGSSGEVLWLNEGFSHYAEELGGRSYELNPDARLADCTIGTTPCRFYSGDLLNASSFLDSTSSHFLIPGSGIGTLAERGAAWLFVRYLVDQYAAGGDTAGWNAVTRSLVQTNLSGANNIEDVTGNQFEDIVSRWALANWVTDAGVPPELQYNSWNLHSVYSSLHTQRPNLFPNFYPLVPTTSAGRDVNMSGTLRSGSPIYHRVTQPAGDPGFTLSVRSANGGQINAAFKPRLNVIRLQ